MFCAVDIYEHLGLCPFEYPGALINENATTRGDRYPDNISGGVISKGDPIGLRLSDRLLT